MALIAVNVYRAATQAITIDEAYTYNTFVERGVADSVKYYDANNHVLHTILVKLSTAVFGVSELTVRLPSVLGGALYLTAVWRLCSYAFGGGWMMLLAVAMLGLNPFVLDYLSIARGYGLGLAFLLLAMDQLTRYFGDLRRGRLYGAGVALGLAVASQLVFLVPGAGLATAFAAIVLRRARSRASVWMLVDHFAIPGIVTAFVILVVPLSRAIVGHYYYGAVSLSQAVWSLVAASFTPWALSVDLWWFIAALALLVAASGAAFVLVLRRAERPGGGEAVAALAGGTMVFSLAALVAAHHAAGVLYPLERTGIYWVPLFVLAGFGLARRRGARAVVAVVSLLCVVQFAQLFRVSYYRPWMGDAGVQRIVAALRARERGARGVRVSGSWEFEPALNFYRRMYRLEWMEPAVRGAPDDPGDYHVFTGPDAGMADRLGLRVLYRDSLTGAVLAR
ncbi:MAG TPA: glycosyltransferase family 39 protein [Bryobacteraceae bacterium]|nr:glycosyltransferase family 39 protein [Bryobacteraceae bacterium]